VPVEHLDKAWNPSVTLDLEAHKPWRRQIFSLGVAQCFVIVVTSVGDSRRDKAHFAAELASCLAETGHARVLLVEADLGEPRLHDILGVALTGEEALARQLVARGTRQAPWSLVRFKPSLCALLQDKPEPGELVLGEDFRDGIIALSDVHDFVIINGPPDETGLIARGFTAWADGAVIVARDHTSPAVVRAMASFGRKQFLRAFAPKSAVR
jgi:Mrp family chromosome partitioning ATPase